MPILEASPNTSNGIPDRAVHLESFKHHACQPVSEKRAILFVAENQGVIEFMILDRCLDEP